jgi:hypothetical protein
VKLGLNKKVAPNYKEATIDRIESIIKRSYKISRKIERIEEFFKKLEKNITVD